MTDSASSVIDTLHILSTARNKLIYDFKNKNHDIYLPIFKYENNPELMRLSLESYFMSWVNLHLLTWSKRHPNKSGKLIYEVVKELLLKIILNIGEIDKHNQNFISNLIFSKIKLIDDLIVRYEVDSGKYNALLLEYEKDKVLFKREFNRLKGEA